MQTYYGSSVISHANEPALGNYSHLKGSMSAEWGTRALLVVLDFRHPPAQEGSLQKCDLVRHRRCLFGFNGWRNRCGCVRETERHDER